ncbi:Cu-processing system ATP-binding protein [Pseudogulbenkiania subflava DSM 22618]|uniref:Cu-processing system ATP-binding protein n=1 Tax=Pseudogulbenkiania subflava DSM 22618 TaxID=1123014 RepID=A0A1Y6BAC7_9NEIS|nr:Cu-processing system ATP-binding protein [Pseudogulbenkiania subflava DSM 22618]
MNPPVIELHQVERRFGTLAAVDGVSFRVERGELFGLTGHNGAGKSTLFKMMLGLLEPSAGSVRVLGTPTRGAAFRAVRRRIGYLPEQLALYDNLSGAETLAYFARLKGANAQQVVPLLDKVGLAHAAQRRVGTYSKGMRQRLGLAQALLGDPQLLFLDEPTNGLDPEAIHAFYQLLAELRAQGVSMILTSHILAEIQQRVDRVAILKAGKLAALGSVAQLREAAALPLGVTLSTSRPLTADELARLDRHAPLRQAADAGQLQLACPPLAKMALLAEVAALGAAVRDVRLAEPSLEDVILGYAGVTP